MRERSILKPETPLCGFEWWSETSDRRENRICRLLRLSGVPLTVCPILIRLVLNGQYID